MCDTSDGREGIRDRLFLTWLEKYADRKRFTFCRAQAIIEDQGIFFVILIENRHPRLQAIIKDFKEKAALLTEDKAIPPHPQGLDH